MSRAAFYGTVTTAAGLVIASGAAAAVFAMVFGDLRVFTPTFVIVAAVALLLGLPVYLAARAARKNTPTVAAVSGFTIGAAIPAILVLTGPGADQASIGYTATVIDGAYTAAGWLKNIALVGFFGLLGTGGALLFWMIVRRGAATEGHSEESASPRPLRTALLSITAAGVIATAFAIPYATADRTCHNPLRDGRTTIGQVASFNLHVGVDEWQDVEDEVERFRRSSTWSKRSDVEIGDSASWLHISLCKETGTNILALGTVNTGEVDFGIYQPQGGSTWQEDFRILYQRISARWPTKISFKDDQGNLTRAPEWAAFKQRR